jgi:hypothetical protein
MSATVLASAPVSSASIKTLIAAHIDAGRILIRPSDLIAYASDASFYRLIPTKRVFTNRELRRRVDLESVVGGGYPLPPR